MQPNLTIFNSFFNEILREDIGICGDITTNALLHEEKLISFNIISREKIVLCGLEIACWYLENFGIKSYEVNYKDGDIVEPGRIILSGHGDARKILMLERTILNFMQHLSGVATVTNRYVEEVKGTNAKITDTRKTLPGLRIFQKYAVRCGGGENHRGTLDSAIMIKDNHINLVGSVSEAIKRARLHNPHYAKIIVECDTSLQFSEALDLGAEIILLDNMTEDEIKSCVQYNNKKSILVASGGITLSNVKKIAETGIDYIAIGAITHSVKAVDIGLDFE